MKVSKETNDDNDRRTQNNIQFAQPLITLTKDYTVEGSHKETSKENCKGKQKGRDKAKKIAWSRIHKSRSEKNVSAKKLKPL